MIIVCNYKQSQKKCFKKKQKFVISKVYDDPKIENSYTTILNCFLPPMELFEKYIDGEIDTKKYYKKYSKHIRSNDELYSTLVLLMLGYNKEKNIVLICSDDEMQFGYMNFLCKILTDDFGVEVKSYSKWKEKKKFDNKSKIDIKALRIKAKEYKTFFDGNEDSKKKSKKKKKKAKKNKKKSNIMDDFILTDDKKKPSKKKKSKLEKKGFILNKKRILYIRRRLD